jgi:hypothetical protein
MKTPKTLVSLILLVVALFALLNPPSSTRVTAQDSLADNVRTVTLAATTINATTVNATTLNATALVGTLASTNPAVSGGTYTGQTNVNARYNGGSFGSSTNRDLTATFLPVARTDSILTNSVVAQVSGNIGVGTNAPHATAALEVTSITGGLVVPRMTGTQRDALSSPLNGTVLYNATTDKLQVRAAGSWVDLH